MNCFANLLNLTMVRSSRKASTETKFHLTIPIFYVNSGILSFYNDLLNKII